MKSLKILMKNSLMSPEIRFKVAHCIKNCINIDSEEKESSNDEDNFTFEDSELNSSNQSKESSCQNHKTHSSNEG